MRAACGNSDAELVRLTQLRVAAECSGGDDGGAASAAGSGGRDALPPTLVAQAQTAADPCVAFAAAEALRALARQDCTLRARLCALLFAAAASQPAQHAKRRRVNAATPPHCVHSGADAAAAASLELLHDLLRDAADDGAEALAFDALCDGVAASVAAAAGAACARHALHAARLLKSVARRATPAQASALCAAALDAAPGQALLTRLLEGKAAGHRHTALSLLRAAAPALSPAAAAAAAAALARGCEALLAPPAAGEADAAAAGAARWTPFAPGSLQGSDDCGALRRRALRAAALLCSAFVDGAAGGDEVLRQRWVQARAEAEQSVSPGLAHAWRHATRDAASADACAAAACALLAAEDDVLAETLAAAAAAGLACPTALVAAVFATLRHDDSVVLDMLLEASSGPHLLSLLCAAGRTLAAPDEAGQLARDAWRRQPEAARTAARLAARLARLHAAELLPFNAAPLLRRLETMRCKVDET